MALLNTVFHLTIFDSIVWKNANSASDAAGATVYLKFEEDVDVIIGSSDSKVIHPMLHLTSFWNLPHISWDATDPQFSDKQRYPTFVRTLGTFSAIGKAFAMLFLKFNWRRADLFYQEWGVCHFAAKGIMTNFRRKGIFLTHVRSYKEDISDTVLETYLEETKINDRIIIFCNENHRRFMLMACAMGMCNGKYLFIYPYSLGDDEAFIPWQMHDEFDLEAKEAYKHLWAVSFARWTSNETEAKISEFRKQIPKKMAEAPFYNTYALDHDLTGATFTPYLWSAGYIYGLWVSYSLSNGLNPRDGRSFYEFSCNVSFDGLIGTVTFDSNGDRNAQYWIWDFTRPDGMPEILALVDLTKSDNNDISMWKKPKWYTSDGRPVVDTDPCGFSGELCEEDQTVRNAIIAGSCSAVCGCVLAVLVIVYIIRKNKSENELLKMVWKVNIHEVEKYKLRKIGFSLASCSQLSAASTHSNTSQPFNTSCATYRGTVVAIKYIKRNSIAITREYHLQLKGMRNMHHENVNPFIGACVDPNNVCILYTYCSRGSLKDILENDEIQLDWMFKFSLVTDIVQGMMYIHNSIVKSHGRLKSSNCVVDNRWVLRITDYGLSSFYEGAGIKEYDENRLCEDMMDFGQMTITKVSINTVLQSFKAFLWTAPELLRMLKILLSGTQEGDVYSFAIILHEIVYRRGIFPSDALTPIEIVNHLRDPSCAPYRPEKFANFEKNELSLVNLMDMCWKETPLLRPTFDTIKGYLRRNSKGVESNVMDTMLKKLEKYASNLEDLVEQRTQELMQEKNKMDTLLCKMLPVIVADKLKRGEHVGPELFKSVTVFFSEIVGFIQLSASSKPIQVVNLLNDLYTLFDDIIAVHDVYKVETIRDSYMVVSGLPKRNGDLHAGQIADMALTFLSSLMNFRIRHMTGRKLQIQIGIHSGPCCSGIVGLTMPRYCLFGDTINTASRMESTGHAQRIHISEHCNNLLDVLGGYETMLRGEIQIKGKGMMTTYWLIGKEGCKQHLSYEDF